LWESEYYTWDPVTKKTQPKTPQSYSYNPATNKWDTTEYRYDPASNKYVPNKVSSNSNPSTVALAPPSSPSGNTSNFAFDLFYNANISNNINSQAYSGDASVFGNTTGGSATTGDAAAIANIINVLQSTASFLGGAPITTFSSNLNGDWVGDLVIDPAVLASLQPATMSDDTNVKVNVDQNGQINNNVTLDAGSGDASVQKNTTSGDATSGDANAVANIVNLMNSAISSGDSFIGMLNIYGNLDGDILLPPGVLDSLLASNATAPATTSLGDQNIENSELLAQFTDTQAINNNVNATATTGQATVDHNTQAGNATTGDAATNITVLNLTGKQIVGANSLLVFVNVLGKWVGVIMDAPTGATAAALGDKTSTVTGGLTGDLTTNTNNQINNNIDVNAASGDATVANNTKAGNATTGDATASVNLLNIMNSSLSFSNWFGVLFINVFGSWNGSFGKDTTAGTQPQAPAAQTAAAGAGSNNDVQVFRFEPTGQGTQRLVRAQYGGGAGQGPQTDNPIVAAANVSNHAPEVQVQTADNNSQVSSGWVLPTMGFFAGSSLLGGERLVSRRQRRRSLKSEI
jgi:hypothetical protein